MTPTPRLWWECDWSPGRPRRFGNAAHVLYADAPVIGSATAGPTEQEACLNVRRAAEWMRRQQERALREAVRERYCYYQTTHGSDYGRYALLSAVARDLALDTAQVGAALMS